MSALTITPVTPDNVRAVIALQVAPDQLAFIEPNAQSLAEVRTDPQFDWHPFALVRDGVAVGFAMVGAYNAAQGYIWLDRFMIDAALQHQGLGGQFLPLICAQITHQWAVRDIVLSYAPTNRVAAQFYAKHGFEVVQGMTDGDDTMAVLHVRA
ncbi:GNAT family N-acetyltransferase [Lacticaseibacillus absianus]|uniref:GNAT family N-acetyltransferase n=1 Tax=Lacticaseibacillus absianus TaxID=2729623 RepID=UPI0015CCF544|nr:GNAT family N-acetyltransferase [Lacticaseibacillus absianus]